MGGWKIRHPNELTVGGTADIAESKEIAFEIRVRRSEDDQWFVVKMKFIELIEPIEFRPSLITLQCSNGETLKGKPLSCYNEKWDIESLFQS
jgi:hypothetical protein